jgi:hypothetical protein
MYWPRNSGGGLVWWEAMVQGGMRGGRGGERWDKVGGLVGGKTAGGRE